MARFNKLEFEQPDEFEKSQALSRPTFDAETWMKRADQCRRIGTYESALQYYSRSLEEDKSQIRCWVGQVQMLVLLGEFPEADLWSKKALEIFPSNPELLASRSQSLCRQAKMADAQATIDMAMHQEGESAYRWAVRGELLLANRQSTARNCFDKANRCSQDWLVPLENSLIYGHYRQPSNALIQAKLAVDRDSSAPYPWYVMARCQMDLGMQTQAHRTVLTCLELKPDYQDAAALLLKNSWSIPFWNRIRRLWSN
ncbi:tetratricopeptide repeat protein [Planctomicrobium sp. SH527]|uniref:tetratricopeptide repeat protein n=1 Tax=Planctomicrobium sp. SH527 TaxID=3448123 RepID=UPI003F5C86A7